METLSVLVGPELSEGTPIGTTTVAGRESLVCIPTALRFGHVHLLGKPVQGKSTVAENMILDDIRKGHGVAVLDPHHDLADRILSLLTQEVIDRVIYFNPSDPDWVPPWNPMQKIPGQDIGRITADLPRLRRYRFLMLGSPAAGLAGVRRTDSTLPLYYSRLNIPLPVLSPPRISLTATPRQANPGRDSAAGSGTSRSGDHAHYQKENRLTNLCFLLCSIAFFSCVLRARLLQ